MITRTYYEILELPQSATQEDIKQQYHKLAKKYHPDANKTDKYAEEKFKEIAEAYSHLSDPVKRANYDRLLAQLRNDISPTNTPVEIYQENTFSPLGTAVIGLAAIYGFAKFVEGLGSTPRKKNKRVYKKRVYKKRNSVKKK